MTLYDLMINAMFHQVFHVYVGNIYDQNIAVGHGIRRNIMDENVTATGIDHLMDKVENWYVAKDGSVVVVLRDDNFYERAESQYDAKYVARWDDFKPETRPWKYSCEMEK